MKKFRYVWILALIALDQIVKFAVRSNMEVGQSIPVINNVFHLTYVRNTGAAFNLFTGHAAALTAVTALAMIVVLWLMEMNKHRHTMLIMSLALIVAGGVGNLLDRAIIGYVTDIFDFRVFPVFNVADIAICTGCGLLILYIILFAEKDEAKKSEAKKAGEAEEASEQ